jgi:hypothetical protein
MLSDMSMKNINNMCKLNIRPEYTTIPYQFKCRFELALVAAGSYVRPAA